MTAWPQSNHAADRHRQAMSLFTASEQAIAVSSNVESSTHMAFACPLSANDGINGPSNSARRRRPGLVTVTLILHLRIRLKRCNVDASSITDDVLDESNGGRIHLSDERLTIGDSLRRPAGRRF